LWGEDVKGVEAEVKRGGKGKRGGRGGRGEKRRRKGSAGIALRQIKIYDYAPGRQRPRVGLSTIG